VKKGSQNRDVTVTVGYRTHSTTRLPWPCANIFDSAGHVPIDQNTVSLKGKENVSGTDITMQNATNQKCIFVSYAIGLITTSPQGN
jgi:hypothetical protein